MKALIVLRCCLLVAVASKAFSPDFTSVSHRRHDHSQLSRIIGDQGGARGGRRQVGPPVVQLSPKHNPRPEERSDMGLPVRFPDLTRLMSSIPSTSAGLNSLEVGCVVFIERLYIKTLAIKCPFFRRRMADLLDSIDMVIRFVVIRHKSLDIVGPPPSWRAPDASAHKQLGLPIAKAAEVIRRDWREDTNKGYYVTGRLNLTIYRDDCIFDGPDPDMPVRGLRKYLNAASQLFDQGKSRAELLSLDVVNEHQIVARWRMNGVLRLPWKPKLPDWTGTTVYHRDERGLIYKHEETWDLSVFQAFLLTFLPSVSRKLGWTKRGSSVPPKEDECFV